MATENNKCTRSPSGGQKAKAECQQGCVCPERSGEFRSLPLPASVVPVFLGGEGRHSHLCPHRLLLSVSGSGRRRSHLCLCVHLASSSSVRLSFHSVSFLRMLVIGFRAHPGNPGWLPLNPITSSRTLYKSGPIHRSHECHVDPSLWGRGHRSIR